MSSHGCACRKISPLEAKLARCLAVDPSSDWWNKESSGAEVNGVRESVSFSHGDSRRQVDNLFFAGIQNWRSTTGEATVWQGQEYEAGKEPPLAIFREIVWELCERSLLPLWIGLITSYYQTVVPVPTWMSTFQMSCLKTGTHFQLEVLRRLIGWCCFHSINKSRSRANDFRVWLQFVVALFTVTSSWKGDKNGNIFNLSAISPKHSQLHRHYNSKKLLQRFTRGLPTIILDEPPSFPIAFIWFDISGTISFFYAFVDNIFLVWISHVEKNWW